MADLDKQALALLDAVRDVLSNPDRWCKEAAGKDADGDCVDPRDDTALRWCVLGALRKVHRAPLCDDVSKRALAALRGVIDVADGANGIARWNDAEDTTHAELLRVLDASIARLKEHA